MRWVALAVALLAAGCAGSPELHVHWEQARVRPVVLSYTTDDGGVVDDPNYQPTLRDRAAATPVGLRLTVPFDLGWPGPPGGPRWVHDPGAPTGPYSAPVLIDGRR